MGPPLSENAKQMRDLFQTTQLADLKKPNRPSGVGVLGRGARLKKRLHRSSLNALSRYRR